jgi:hypothetical protein
MSIEWIVGIAITIVCGLIGIIYWAGQSRDDKQDDRFERNEHALNEHIRECAEKHERLVRNETKVETLEFEVGKIRDMRHEMMKHTTEALATWYASVVDMAGKRFAELVALIDRAKK